MPKQGLGGWAGSVNETAEIDDPGVRAVSAKNNGKLTLPNGVPFATPSEAETKNIVFTSQWDNYPREVVIPLSGKSRQFYLLMAGSTNPMQSRIDNGEIIVTYREAARNGSRWKIPRHGGRLNRITLSMIFNFAALVHCLRAST